MKSIQILSRQAAIIGRFTLLKELWLQETSEIQRLTFDSTRTSVVATMVARIAFQRQREAQ